MEANNGVNETFLSDDMFCGINMCRYKYIIILIISLEVIVCLERHTKRHLCMRVIGIDLIFVKEQVAFQDLVAV